MAVLFRLGLFLVLVVGLSWAIIAIINHYRKENNYRKRLKLLDSLKHLDALKLADLVIQDQITLSDVPERKREQVSEFIQKIENKL